AVGRGATAPRDQGESSFYDVASLGSGRAMGGDSAPSCGGSMVMFGRSLSSQRGMYHVFFPISVNSEGISVIFTMRASVRMATASSRPNSLETRSGVRMNAEKTAAIV